MDFGASRAKLDFGVGLLMLGACLFTVFIALQAANITSVSEADGYIVRARFDNVGTLAVRSPVKSSGVRVGQVKAISLHQEDYTAEVEMVIETDYAFPIDSIFSVVSSNLLGGQYISIEPGGDEKNLAEGAVVNGNSAIVLEELIATFLFEKTGE